MQWDGGVVETVKIEKQVGIVVTENQEKKLDDFEWKILSYQELHY